MDPLTGPITRTALQSLRQAAVAAEVPVLVTAGLGHATREAAYGADPAVLLKALAPARQRTAPVPGPADRGARGDRAGADRGPGRRGIQVARAGADTDAVTLADADAAEPGGHGPDAGAPPPGRDRRLAARQRAAEPHPAGRLHDRRLDPAELPRLASGETVLFLAERATSAEVQGRIVDLLAKIGTN